VNSVTTSEQEVIPAPHGRTMDTKLDDVIMKAALDLVGEVGYEKVSMEAIATRCRSSKATIYRRWDSKAALVTQAMSRRHAGTHVLPDTGELRGDLIASLQLMTQQFRAEDLDLMTGLLTSLRSDPELAVLVREQMIEKKQVVWRELVARAVARGELAASTDPSLIDEVSGGIVFMRLVVTGQKIDEQFVVHLVDDILLPVLTKDAIS
jgi:AcrR family transcriptional regulator